MAARGRAKCTRSKTFSESTGVSNTREGCEILEHETVQLPNLPFIFGMKKTKKFFWDDEDTNATFPF